MVKDFHRKTLPKNWQAKNTHGATVDELPIQRVGLYIPGECSACLYCHHDRRSRQAGALPRNRGLYTPRSDGTIAPGMLAALALVGIEEVYKVGGVQAIGAMAYNSGDCSCG